LWVARGFLTDISNTAERTWAHFRAIWWLRSLIYAGLTIVAFAIWVQLTRDTEDPNIFTRWVYEFLNDWAITLGAAATIMLAAGAFMTILDNRQGRIQDRRERLLADIIDWALEIRSCVFKEGWPSYPILELMRKRYRIERIGTLLLSYESIMVQKTYIKIVAGRFDDQLVGKVDIVYASMETLCNTLISYKDAIAKNKEVVTKIIEEYRNNTQDLMVKANDLLEAASDIKVIDL